MITLYQVTRIHAPIQRCFLLSLSIDLELACLAPFSGKAIGGRCSGLIQAGERVSWSVQQFGLPIRHTSEITQYNAPSHFQDAMVSGIFHSFAHDHYFNENDGITEMRDQINLAAPLGILGRFAESLFIRKRMLRLLAERNRLIKLAAETEKWRQYLPPHSTTIKS